MAAETDAVVAQLVAAGGGMHVNRIVVWNTHNSTGMDRGATEINVTLLLRGKAVWRRERIAIEWRSDKCMSVELHPPPVAASIIRVEITQWHGWSGGLSEIQVFAGDRNLCAGEHASVSSSFGAGYPASNLTDGNLDLPQYKGYWVLPDKQPGWAEVDIKSGLGAGK